VKAKTLVIATATAAGFAVACVLHAQPVGIVIAPGIYLQPSGIYLKPSCVYFRPFGVTFNPLYFDDLFANAARLPYAFGRNGFVGDRFGLLPGEQGFGMSPEGGERGFLSEGRRGFGRAVDLSVLEERAIRNSGTTIGRQSTTAIGRQNTTAIGPQSGESAISPEDISPHIEHQEQPRSVTGGTGPNALSGRGVGHGGGHR